MPNRTQIYDRLSTNLISERLIVSHAAAALDAAIESPQTLRFIH
jgi:hypothetical protein